VKYELVLVFSRSVPARPSNHYLADLHKLKGFAGRGS